MMGARLLVLCEYITISFYPQLPHGQQWIIRRILMMIRDKKVHADRRKLSSAKMSKGNVGDLHDLVASKISVLMERLLDMTRGHKLVNIFAAWRIPYGSMTLDIISTFAFGHSLNALDRDGLDHEMLDTMESALATFYKVTYCFGGHLTVC